MTPDEIQNFKDWQVPLPSRDPHGTDSPENPIGSNLQRVILKNWRLIGNKLTADTQFGEYSYLIPPNYIMTGTDDQGLPKLTKIET